jgi:hypothetical protein
MTNLQAHYAKNAAGLAKMLAKAEATGKLVGGYTAEQLRVLVTDYRKLAGL